MVIALDAFPAFCPAPHLFGHQYWWRVLNIRWNSIGNADDNNVAGLTTPPRGRVISGQFFLYAHACRRAALLARTARVTLLHVASFTRISPLCPFVNGLQRLLFLLDTTDALHLYPPRIAVAYPFCWRVLTYVPPTTTRLRAPTTRKTLLWARGRLTLRLVLCYDLIPFPFAAPYLLPAFPDSSNTRTYSLLDCVRLSVGTSAIPAPYPWRAILPTTACTSAIPLL